MDRSRTPTPWSRTTEAALIVGFWAVLGALALVRRSLDPRGPSGVDTPGLIITLAEYGLWAALTPLMFALVRRLRFEPGGRLWRALAYVAAAFAVAVLVEWVRQRLFATVFPDAFDARWRGGGRGHRPRFQPGLAGIVMQFRFLDEFVIAVAVLVAGFARDALVRLRERRPTRPVWKPNSPTPGSRRCGCSSTRTSSSTRSTPSARSSSAIPLACGP